MGLLAIFGLDLSGKLRSQIRAYKNQSYTFDNSLVRIFVTYWEYNDWYTVTASAYCNDPSAGGFDIHPISNFYSSPRFQTRVEADAHVEAEVRRACRRHPGTRFIRSREDNGKAIEEVYSKGRWFPVEAKGFQNRCEGCGEATDDPICPYCGEMTI